MTIQPLILAAGKGKRMGGVVKASIPLHGKPLIQYVLDALKVCEGLLSPAMVVAPDSPVPGILGNAYTYIVQSEPKGTGHAVAAAKSALQGKASHILVLPVDQPRIKPALLTSLAQESMRTHAMITMAVAQVPHFSGEYTVFNDWGRIVRATHGAVDAIVELKDTTEAQRALCEVNASIYFFNAAWLWENIDKLQSTNAQGEYYLTDLVVIARRQGHTVASVVLQDPFEVIGINTPEQLKMAGDLLEANCHPEPFDYAQDKLREGSLQPSR